MKLDAWLEQDHSLDERLRVIECLCQAVNEVHDQGEALGTLEPARVEVSPGRRCDISAAGSGLPSPPYTAPDHESSIPTATADVYAAGVIAWEILAGRSAGRSPRHLAEVRPDLSSELADAVMACLEGKAEWRPKDLTYLAQMAAARQSNAGRTPDTSRVPLPPRQAPPRTSSRRPSRRTWPLLAALVVLLGLAAFEWKDYLGIGVVPAARTTPAPLAPAATSPPATEPPSAHPTTAAETDEGLGTPAAATPDAAPIPPPSEAGPADRREAAPVDPPVAAPVAPPVPLPPPEPVVPPATAAPEDTAPEPTAGGQPSPPETEARAAPSTPAPTVEPAVLEAVSPLEVRRPGKVLLDLRGQRFQPRHRVRVLPVKKVPWGIKIIQEKHVSDTLITVLVEFSDKVEPGDYAFAVEDGLGARSDPVVFKVTE